MEESKRKLPVDPQKPMILHYQPDPPAGQMSPKEKIAAYQHARADIEIDQRTINPMMYFRRGDVINVNFDDDARRHLSGLYKVQQVKENGVQYRKLYLHEKVSYIVRNRGFLFFLRHMAFLGWQKVRA